MKKLLFIFLFFTSVCYAQTFDNNVLFNKNVIFKGKTIASNDSIRFTNNGDTMTVGVRNNHGYITCYTCDSIQIYPSVIGSGGGGGGNIKSDGSVNFVKPEKWAFGHIDSTIIDTGSIVLAGGDYTATTFPSSFSTRATNTRSTLTGDGYLQLENDLSASQITIYRTVTVTLSNANVLTLNSVPVSAVAGRANYVTEIVSGYCVWTVGATNYDGVASLYFYSVTDLGKTPQFKIDCPFTIANYVQRGVPVQTTIGQKANITTGDRVMVTTDYDSSVGTSTLTLYLNIRETKVQ